MHEDGTFEINTHHGEDDESMSDQTEEERRTCLKVNQAKPVKIKTLTQV